MNKPGTCNQINRLFEKFRMTLELEIRLLRGHPVQQQPARQQPARQQPASQQLARQRQARQRQARQRPGP
jgi:hypothetical protein